MRGATYFLRDCPTCGRKVQVRVEYLGRRVACRHCHGVFEATDPMLDARRTSESGIHERVEQLLAMDPPSVILRDAEF